MRAVGGWLARADMARFGLVAGRLAPCCRSRASGWTRTACGHFGH